MARDHFGGFFQLKNLAHAPTTRSTVRLMTAERTLCALVWIAAAGACNTMGGGTDPGPDAPPVLTYEPFVSKTWSLSTMAGATQLSITNGGGAAACALSQDYRQTLGGAGVQIILQFPGTPPAPCPVGEYQLVKNCASSFGSGAFVPAGCAYYRKWDAQGTQLGMTIAIDGIITIAGSATECMIRASITFLGNSFIENFTLMDGATAQPWCREG